MSTERTKLGVHSEAGRLRKVMVCLPGFAHRRPTFGGCDELLLDDVIQVNQVKRDHSDFVAKVHERGIGIFGTYNLLIETIQNPETLKWVLNHKITTGSTGLGLTNELCPWLGSLEPRKLAEYLIDGAAAGDLPASEGVDILKMYCEYPSHSSSLLPPLPNTQFTRNTTYWIYGGVTLNPMCWPARRQETSLATITYKFHPELANAEFEIWHGDPDKDHGFSTLEGGDVTPIGSDVVLIGMGERSPRQAIDQITQLLLARGVVERVIVAGLPRSRAAMYLDTAFSFCDRDPVTVFPKVAREVALFGLCLDPGNPYGMNIRREGKAFLEIVTESLGLRELCMVETGGNSFVAERERWGDGNSVVRLEPDVAVGYDRNIYTNALLYKAGVEAITISASKLGRDCGGGHCMACPIVRNPIDH